SCRSSPARWPRSTLPSASGRRAARFGEPVRPTLLLAFSLASCAAPAPRAPEAPAIAIVDTTVVPMDTDRELPHHTVIVRGDRIVAVGPKDDVSVPGGARVIDGRGRYVLPGLADMHVHMFDEDLRRMYLTAGVTFVRIMWGHPGTVWLREAIARGEEI